MLLRELRERGYTRLTHLLLKTSNVVPCNEDASDGRGGHAGAGRLGLLRVVREEDTMPLGQLGQGYP